MKTRHLFFALLFSITFSFAQQESGFSHYMFNHQAINPGYAGSRGLSSFTSVLRSQWSGIEGAPITQTLSFNAPITSKKLGFGLSILNDKKKLEDIRFNMKKNNSRKVYLKAENAVKEFI